MGLSEAEQLLQEEMRAAKSLYKNNLIHQFANSNSNKASLTKLHHIPDTMTDETKSVTSDLIVLINIFTRCLQSQVLPFPPTLMSPFLLQTSTEYLSPSQTLEIFYQL